MLCEVPLKRRLAALSLKLRRLTMASARPTGKGCSMPYQSLPDGLFLLKRPSPDKGVEHYGVLDVGNRFGLPEVDGSHPVVAHQTPPSVQFDWLQDTGTWQIVGQVTDEEAAIARLAVAMSTPGYNLF